MAYPYPTLNVNGTDSDNLYHLTKFVSDGVSGTLMPVLLLTIWIIAFIGALAEGRQASRGFIFASFICSILAIIASLIGLLASQYMYFSFLLLAGGVIWYKLDNAVGI